MQLLTEFFTEAFVTYMLPASADEICHRSFRHLDDTCNVLLKFLTKNFITWMSPVSVDVVCCVRKVSNETLTSVLT
jgi:hypothetical protein